MLQRSAMTALEPWRIDVAPVHAATPSLEIPAASRAAQAIAASSGVDAVAWISESHGERTLFLYDARSEQIVSRAISGDPSDEIAAASIALTLKTLLRASTVAPPQERLGGREESRAIGIGLFRLEADAAARLWSLEHVRLDGRLGLALSWWPGPLDRRVGFTLRLEDGLGATIEDGEFRGRFADHAAELLVRARFPFASRFALEPAAGFGLHLTTLDGAPIDQEPPVDMTRLNPTAAASVAATYALGRGFEVGLRAGASYWLRWQAYVLDGSYELSVAPLHGSFGLIVGAPLN